MNDIKYCAEFNKKINHIQRKIKENNLVYINFNKNFKIENRGEFSSICFIFPYFNALVMEKPMEFLHRIFIFYNNIILLYEARGFLYLNSNRNAKWIIVFFCISNLSTAPNNIHHYYYINHLMNNQHSLYHHQLHSQTGRIDRHQNQKILMVHGHFLHRIVFETELYQLPI